MPLTGQVLNEQGQALPGVTVRVKDTANLTTTNAGGYFLLELDVPEAILVLTCQGYRTQAVAVQVGTPLTITLYGVAGTVVTGGPHRPHDFRRRAAGFSGGGVAYRAYLRQNAHYPEKARGQQGAVYVSFVVDEEGQILNAEIIKSNYPIFEAEALRLIRLMPWWTPGRLAGKPVRVACTLRINFGFQTE